MDLNIIIYIAPPLVIENEIEDKDGNINKKYTGLLYDLWTQIKQKLQSDNVIGNVNETFVGPNTNTTMKETYTMIEEGKYDIGIGYFSIVQSRDKTHFTRPIYLNKFCLAYLPDTLNYEMIFMSLLRGFIIPFVIGIIISLIIAYCIIYFTMNKNKTQVWDVIITILFRYNYFYAHKRNIFSFLILVLSLFFVIYLQSEMTTTVAILKSRLYDEKITRDTIISRNILVPKGYATSVIWKKYGARIHESKTDDILQEYKDNRSFYHGFFDDLEVLKLFRLKEPDLKISKENFGFDEIAWPVSKDPKYNDFLFHLNNEIVKFQDNDKLFNLCRSYFVNDAYLCQL